MSRALVAGWFSFEGMGATAGDLMAADVVGGWLDAAGYPFDRATAPPFDGGVDWQAVRPTDYSDVVFVCGPLGNGPPVDAFLARFEHARLAALDVTMLQRLADWDPFDLLLERDSDRAARPDLAFLAPPRTVPLVGVVLVHAQREYGAAGRHAAVQAVVDQYTATHDVARVDLDTRLDVPNPVGRTPAAIESVVRRLDTVITTRLHGMVLALRCGLAPVVVDPIAGGAKVSRQAAVIGWPVLAADSLRDDRLATAVDWSLTDAARAEAAACRERALSLLAPASAEFARHVAESA